MQKGPLSPLSPPPSLIPLTVWFPPFRSFIIVHANVKRGRVHARALPRPTLPHPYCFPLPNSLTFPFPLLLLLSRPPFLSTHFNFYGSSPSATASFAIAYARRLFQMRAIKAAMLTQSIKQLISNYDHRIGHTLDLSDIEDQSRPNISDSACLPSFIYQKFLGSRWVKSIFDILSFGGPLVRFWVLDEFYDEIFFRFREGKFTRIRWNWHTRAQRAMRITICKDYCRRSA